MNSDFIASLISRAMADAWQQAKREEREPMNTESTATINADDPLSGAISRIAELEIALEVAGKMLEKHVKVNSDLGAENLAHIEKIKFLEVTLQAERDALHLVESKTGGQQREIEKLERCVTVLMRAAKAASFAFGRQDANAVDVLQQAFDEVTAIKEGR